jgi:hypothetical protein
MVNGERGAEVDPQITQISQIPIRTRRRCVGMFEMNSEVRRTGMAVAHVGPLGLAVLPGLFAPT